MTQITVENFTQAMREAVAERGADYVYPAVGSPEAIAGWRGRGYEHADGPFSNQDVKPGYGGCKYVLKDGTPACIIGLALYKIDPALLPKANPSAQAVLDNLGVNDGALLFAAQKAQEAQDKGKTWGVALEVFEDGLRIEGGLR